MTDPEFRQLVYQLRLAQKKHDRTREDLQGRKQLEQQVDEELEASLKPRPAGMFDSEEWAEDAKELRW